GQEHQHADPAAADGEAAAAHAAATHAAAPARAEAADPATGVPQVLDLRRVELGSLVELHGLPPPRWRVRPGRAISDHPMHGARHGTGRRPRPAPLYLPVSL